MSSTALLVLSILNQAMPLIRKMGLRGIDIGQMMDTAAAEGRPLQKSDFDRFRNSARESLDTLDARLTEAEQEESDQ